MKIELKRGSMNVLNNLLQGTQWYATTKAAYLAGQIVTQVIPEPEDAPKDAEGKPAQGVVLRDWLRKSFELTFTSAQAKTAPECLKYFLEKKELSPGEFIMGLMEAFNLKPDDAGE